MLRNARVAALQGTHATLLETRKTVPGLRLPDKWAVLIGGGQNHRIGASQSFFWGGGGRVDVEQDA